MKNGGKGGARTWEEARKAEKKLLTESLPTYCSWAAADALFSSTRKRTLCSLHHLLVAWLLLQKKKTGLCWKSLDGFVQGEWFTWGSFQNACGKQYSGRVEHKNQFNNSWFKKLKHNVFRFAQMSISVLWHLCWKTATSFIILMLGLPLTASCSSIISALLELWPEIV